MRGLTKAAPGEVEVGHSEEFLRRKMIRHWNGLSGEVVESQPGRCSRTGCGTRCHGVGHEVGMGRRAECEMAELLSAWFRGSVALPGRRARGRRGAEGAAQPVQCGGRAPRLRGHSTRRNRPRTAAPREPPQPRHGQGGSAASRGDGADDREGGRQGGGRGRRGRQPARRGHQGDASRGAVRLRGAQQAPRVQESHAGAAGGRTEDPRQSLVQYRPSPSPFPGAGRVRGPACAFPRPGIPALAAPAPAPVSLTCGFPAGQPRSRRRRDPRVSAGTPGSALSSGLQGGQRGLGALRGGCEGRKIVSGISRYRLAETGGKPGQLRSGFGFL